MEESIKRKTKGTKKSMNNCSDSVKNAQKVLEKAKKTENKFKKVYRVPIPQGYKEVPEKYFHRRKKELLEIATGKIEFVKK